MIDDFGREDRREEDEGQLVAGLREDIEAEEGRLSDTNQDTSGVEFQTPTQEEEGDLAPATVKEMAQMKTTGLSQFDSLKQWSRMPEGPERDAAKARWTQQYYGMSPEQYDESGFFGKFYQGWKNQGPSATSIPAAIGLGALDFVGDVASVHPTLGAIDDWWDNKTRFTNPTLRKWRQFGNIVIPTMVGTGAVLNATKGQRLITQGAATLGVDLAVTGISEDQTNDESITKYLIETFPAQFGRGGRTPLPNALVTTDNMSPMNRKLIHMLEATPFALLGNSIGFLFSRGKSVMGWFKPLDKRAKQYKAIQLARKPDNQIHLQIREIDQIIATKPNAKDIRILKGKRKELVEQLSDNNKFDDFVERTETSKEIQADAAGAEKIKDPEVGFDSDVTPVPGEAITGYNSIPEGSAARNMADVAAIKNGNAPSDGLPTPILTENARRKGLRVSGKESPSRTTIMDIEQQARAMGDFEVISDGIKYSRKTMDKAAEKIFTDIMEAGNVADVQKIFLSERSIVKFADDVSVQFATEPQARAAFWAIRELFDRYIGGPVARASARYMDTTGREIAATAQAMNDYGSELVDDIKQTDIILGKLQYLLTEWGINAKVGSAVLKLKDATATGPGFVPADDLIPHMLDQFKAIENGAHAKAVRFTKELRRLAVENPLAIKPLIHIFEYTKGDVDTLVKLMKWAEDKVDIRGLIISPGPDMNLMAKGLWGVFFNNMLSGIAPLKAFSGNTAMVAVEPLNQLLGAGQRGMFGDPTAFEDFRKIIFWHGSVRETNKRAVRWAWEVFRKVHADPNAMADAIRADFLVKEDKALKILEEAADIYRAKNDIGFEAQYNMAIALRGLYRNKWFRTGMTGMSFVDGMTDVHSATWISRLEAWEDIAAQKGGIFSKEALEQAEKVNYAKKFDKNGVLRDRTAARADAAEKKFNINDDLAASLTKITNKIPPLKHIATFPRAVSNATRIVFSYQPVALIPGATKFADTIWAKTDEEIIAALARHNIDASTTPHYRQIWKAKRDEYSGRLILASWITRGLWDAALDGWVEGPGHYNPSRRARDIKYYGAQPNTIKFPIPGKDNDLRVEFKEIPGIGTLLSLIGAMAYYARDIEQPMYEDVFRKISVTMALSLGDSFFFSSVSKLLDIADGNWKAAQQWGAAQPFIPSSVKLLAKMIDSSYKEVYGDFMAMIQQQIPIAKNYLPDQVNPLTGNILGRSDNKIADIVQAVMPIAVYPESDNTESGKVLKRLRDANWEGVRRLEKDSTGKYEYSNDEKAYINKLVGAQEPWKDLKKILDKPKHKYILGKIRRLRGSGIELDWKKVEFKEDLLSLYRELDDVLKEKQEIAEMQLLKERPDIWQTIVHQSLMDKYIRQGRIDEAVRMGNKNQQMQNLLQMAK